MWFVGEGCGTEDAELALRSRHSYHLRIEATLTLLLPPLIVGHSETVMCIIVMGAQPNRSIYALKFSAVLEGCHILAELCKVWSMAVKGLR